LVPESRNSLTQSSDNSGAIVPAAGKQIAAGWRRAL
jgi:hypothetical protein